MIMYNILYSEKDFLHAKFCYRVKNTGCTKYFDMNWTFMLPNKLKK